MKRTQFVKRLREAAKKAGVEFREVEWTNHTAIHVGDKVTTLGRHSELDEITAGKISKNFEEVLGKGWWRK